MAFSTRFEFIFLTCSILIFHLPGCISQSCGPWPEGAYLTYTCKTETSTFNSFEPRLEYDDSGIFNQTITCDSTGICSSYDSEKYDWEFSDTNGWWNVSASYSLHRSMTAARCFLDGVELADTGCDFYIYAAPKNLACSEPEFPEGRGVAVITCTADVYPDGKCSYSLYTGNEANLGQVRVNETSVDKGDGSGDRIVTCSLEVEANNSMPGSYGISVYWEPYILNNIISSARKGYDVRGYEFVLLSLLSAWDNSLVYEYPTNGILDVFINVLCNPGPISYQLEVKYEMSDAYIHRDDIYRVSYVSVSDFTGGNISISIFGGFDSSRTSYFKFQASNGIQGAPLEIYFAVNPVPLSPPPATTLSIDDSTSTPPVTMFETATSSSPPPPPTQDPNSTNPPPPPTQELTSTNPPPPPTQNSTSSSPPPPPTQEPTSTNPPPPPSQNSTSSSPPPPPTQDPTSTNPPPPPTQDPTSSPGHHHDHGHGNDHYHHSGEHHKECQHHQDSKDHTGGDNPGNNYGYYPGIGYGPYPRQNFAPYPGVFYGPWAGVGYVNPRFGGMVYRPYPPFPDMGWGPYRGWFPWFA